MARRSERRICEDCGDEFVFTGKWEHEWRIYSWWCQPCRNWRFRTRDWTRRSAEPEDADPARPEPPRVPLLSRLSVL